MTKRQHKDIWTIFTTAPTTHPSPAHWKSLAHAAESAKLHGLVIVDELVEPSVYAAALGNATKSLGLIIGYTTKGEHPYLQARKFATLDTLNHGRLGWANTPELRYSEEYFQVFAHLLLSSWRDDALLKDKESGVWIDTDRLRQIDFEGETYQVPGPGLSKPTPQRLPLIVSLDTSTDAGRRHSAKYAEVISVAGDKDDVKLTVKSLRKLAEEFGRDPITIKFLAQVFIVVGETDGDAKKNFAEGVTPPQGYFSIVGSVSNVADTLQEWKRAADVDGINIHASNINNWGKSLIPELQSRGLAQSEYYTPGATLRENTFDAKYGSYLSQDHPLYKHRWFKSQSQEEFETVLNRANAKLKETATNYS